MLTVPHNASFFKKIFSYGSPDIRKIIFFPSNAITAHYFTNLQTDAFPCILPVMCSRYPVGATSARKKTEV